MRTTRFAYRGEINNKQTATFAGTTLCRFAAMLRLDTSLLLHPPCFSASIRRPFELRCRALLELLIVTYLEQLVNARGLLISPRYFPTGAIYR